MTIPTFLTRYVFWQWLFINQHGKLSIRMSQKTHIPVEYVRVIVGMVQWNAMLSVITDSICMNYEFLKLTEQDLIHSRVVRENSLCSQQVPGIIYMADFLYVFLHSIFTGGLIIQWIHPNMGHYGTYIWVLVYDRLLADHTTSCPWYQLFMLPAVHATSCPCYHLPMLPPVHATSCPCYQLFMLKAVHTFICPCYQLFILSSVQATSCSFYQLSMLPAVHLTICSLV